MSGGFFHDSFRNWSASVVEHLDLAAEGGCSGLSGLVHFSLGGALCLVAAVFEVRGDKSSNTAGIDDLVVSGFNDTDGQFCGATNWSCIEIFLHCFNDFED